MASQSRLLQILLLYSEAQSAFSVEEMASRLGTTISTAYRDLKKLREAGLIESNAEDRYILGGRISVLDRVARVTDPLLNASIAEMQRLAGTTGLTVTLTRLYGDRVIGVGHVDGNRRLSIGYERGQVVPLLRGCTGKVILAALPWRRLKRLYEANKDDPDVRALGEDWPQFLKAARSFGRNPLLWTEGEITPENIAVAGVLMTASGLPAGSLTIIIRRDERHALDLEAIERELQNARARIEANLRRRSRGPK